MNNLIPKPLRRFFNWRGLAFILLLLIVWQMLVSSKLIHYSSLPGPIGIGSGFGYIASNGMWPELLHTVRCVVIAWAVAMLIGGFAGLLLGLNPKVASWTGSTVDLFRSLPVVAFVPIVILIWGTGSKSEIILGAYAALWPVLLNTAAGVRQVPAGFHDVATTMRLTRTEKLFKITIPSTGGPMLVGARLALTGSLVVCVVAEMLGLQSGVGNALVLEQAGDEPARMWAYVIIVGILGLLANSGLIAAVRMLFPGVAAIAQRSAQ